IVLTIEPHKIQYTGNDDVTIRCELGESDLATIGWMQISKQNLLMNKTPFLVLRISDGTGPEWGSEIDDAKMDEKTTVRYSLEPLDETYLEVTLDQIECGDDGVYSCEVFGLNQNEETVKETIREELIVYSFGQRPVITYFSATIPEKKLTVTRGSEVTLLCNGMVGKPHLPITWYQFIDKAGAFVSLKEHVSE
ncbi:uncharacterized protein LOC110444489, partial [Mizuhopecten yessoensis]|uniref:uncharacterized protein LOC110444489 n=1 Tax=Mizuhopecten yessoensis TaxID=6573 RepID=UPI000B45E93B